MSRHSSHETPRCSVTGKQPQDNQMILLVDHGSKRAAANDMLQDIATMLQEKTDLRIHTAHMELAEPTIADGVEKCVQDGAKHIIVVPYFLSPGRHSTTDIPNIMQECASKFQDLTYEVRPPIGTHPGMIDIILDRAGLLGSKSK